MTDPLFAARARARFRFFADRALARADSRASALAAADDEHGDTITTTPPHPIAQ